MQPVITKKLESLSAEKQEWILDLAAHSQRLADVIGALRKHEIEVSLSTLTRFVREHRERVVMADGESMKGAVETLAKRGSGEALRKGTLEAIRQRLYEDSLSPTNSKEETLRMYGELLKEEARLKELELAERKLALAEEQVRLQKVRLRLAARQMGGRKRVKLDAAEVVEEVEVGEGANASGEAGMTNDKAQMTKELEIKNDKCEATTGAMEKVKLLAGVMARVEEILNRGGSPEERVLEARSLLGDGQKLLVESSG